MYKIKRNSGADKRAVLCLLLLTAALAGCRKQNTEPAGSSTQSSIGERTKKAVRIISTAPSNTDIIAALGQAHRLAAIDNFSDSVSNLPPEIIRIDFLNPNAETLIALKPDLIIAHSMNEMKNGSEPLAIMKKLGVDIVYIKTSNSLDGIMEDIGVIANLLDVPERGDALVSGMRTEIESVRKIGSGIDGAKRRSVYFEVEPAPHAVSFGSGVFLDEMITICGADNIFAGTHGFFTANGEAVIDRNPDVILTNASEIPDPVGELYLRAGFENIKAHKNKRIYYIDTDASARPTHNVIKALHQIAFSIYPEYYPPFPKDGGKK
ncbi:MAG: ABC transporter substrate-binding protein [Spirochaetaceae bacterium]|jgi:iron complex transport system substrate-binding protein|nr:ABC transporter substrate-binding protein [Spirochaetaceae bacterium]